MKSSIKDSKSILSKLGVHQLNPMQEEAVKKIKSNSDIVLLSPTGSGKTLAFSLPIIEQLNSSIKGVQALIVVPSRELAIQIEQVVRGMGTGYKVNAVYGGRPISKDRIELEHIPSILIGTPGRVADHIRRETFSTSSIRMVVLDEFDKSLEVGFEDDMIEIMESLLNLEKRILTSATQGVEIPRFVDLYQPKIINYLNEGVSSLEIKVVEANNNFQSLLKVLANNGNEPGIIFCNYKESIQKVSDYLNNNNVSHGCFYGGMEQKDRERALIKFRNQTHRIIVATDLAARGIDVPELKFIIHYELPHHKEEFIHRNGRTARMNNEGTAFVLKEKKDRLPEFIIGTDTISSDDLKSNISNVKETRYTLFVSGGRKDKISKGDIAGLFFKQGHLDKDELGVIELKSDCAFVGVKTSNVNLLVDKVNNTRLKKKKVRVTII